MLVEGASMKWVLVLIRSIREVDLSKEICNIKRKRSTPWHGYRLSHPNKATQRNLLYPCYLHAEKQVSDKKI